MLIRKQAMQIISTLMLQIQRLKAKPFLVPHPYLRGGTLVVPQTFDYIVLHSPSYTYIIPLNPHDSVNFSQTTYLTT